MALESQRKEGCPEGGGWEGYEELLRHPSALAPRAEPVKTSLDYPNGVGSEGCGWDAYPELLPRPAAVEAVERGVRTALEGALSA